MKHLGDMKEAGMAYNARPVLRCLLCFFLQNTRVTPIYTARPMRWRWHNLPPNNRR